MLLRYFRRIILLTSILCQALVSYSADGYYIEDSHLFSGLITGGINLTQVDGDNFRGYYKYGVNVGAGVLIGLKDNFRLGMEILYTQKGSHGNVMKESGNIGVFITKYDLKLNYAEVPLQLYYTDKNDNLFGGGFAYGRLANSTEYYETKPVVNIDMNQYPVRKSDWSFMLSSALKLWKGLYFNARFQYSMLPIRTKVPPGFGRPEQYNHLWTFRLMYRI